MQIWEEHCAGKKHQRNLAKQNGQEAPLSEDSIMNDMVRKKKTTVVVSEGDGVSKGVLVQAAQRLCVACSRAVPVKAWEMHSSGKRHKAKVALITGQSNWSTKQGISNPTRHCSYQTAKH